MKTVLLEALILAAAGAIIAFGANALSPRGITLARDYFPDDHRRPTNPAIAGPTNATPVAGQTNVPAATGGAPSLAARLQAKGLQLIGKDQVQLLLQDPRFAQNRVLIIDARSDDDYKNGHIPGAYQFYYYQPDKYVPTVMPLCSAAEQIIVYCHGGDQCEDSELTATWLRDSGVLAQKLFIYGGGSTEWEQLGLPMELGARGSGKMRPAPAPK